MIHTAELINNQVLEQFVLLYKEDRLAHAYLFVGPKTSGKTQTALSAAKMILCDENVKGDKNQSCGSCPACLKAESGNHPDLHFLASGFKEAIKIEDIRDVISQGQLRPFMGTKKIFIIQNCENLTLEAGNALLKTLEEPSKTSLLILTSSLPEKILSTIRSRCHQVKYLPASGDDLREILSKDYKRDESEAQFLTQMSEGCLGKASQFIDENFLRTKNQIIDQFILSSHEELIKNVLEDKEKTKEFLDVLLSWIRDAILLKSSAGEHYLMHQDRLEDLKRFQEAFTFEELKDIHDDIMSSFKNLADNLNMKIPLYIIKEKLLWARP